MIFMYSSCIFYKVTQKAQLYQVSSIQFNTNLKLMQLRRVKAVKKIKLEGQESQLVCH